MAPTRRRAVIAGLTLLAALGLNVAQPTVLRTTLRSPRALLAIAACVAAAALLSRLAARYGGRTSGIAVRVAVAGLALWLLVVPAFRQRSLDEALPAAAARSGVASPTPAPPGPVEEPSAPVRLTSGPLTGIGHEASGTVATYRLADGSTVVRFEDVDIRGAPDPVLYVVPGPDRQRRDGGVELGPLKATKGTFHHVAPASFDLSQPFTVFVWCERFATPIANADQRSS